MNFDESIDVLLGLAIIAFVLGIFDECMYQALRAEQANNYCIERGFDTYESYSSRAFDTKAYGVKCKMVDYKRVQVSNGEVITVV